MSCGKEGVKLSVEDVEGYLPEMHIGEVKRDAAPGIRGFLFQDLLAVDELIEQETHFICSEYIEDICVITSNGIRIIQSKYTPRTALGIKEITRELYYQYIKLRKFGYNGNIIPILGYHANSASMPDETISMGYLNLSVGQKCFQGTAVEEKALVLKCIKESTKEKRENELFNYFYNPGALKDFLSVYQMKKIKDSIGCYRKSLGKKLDAIFNKDCCPIENDDDRQEVLIALATKLVQDRYNEPQQPIDYRELLEHRKITRKDFFTKLERELVSEPSFNIVVRGFADEAYCELADEQLLSENRIRLERLYASTDEWLKNNMNNHIDVIRLLNTVSTEPNVPNSDTQAKLLRQALFICKENIKTFYFHVWKIKIDLKQNDFQECLIPEIKHYIAFSFRDQKDWAKRSIIMSSISARPNKKLLYIQKRVRAWDDRPQKWYLRSPVHGYGDYSIDVARIASEKLNVTLISSERFAVECMNCIGIDEGEWERTENCAECIFSAECKGEK